MKQAVIDASIAAKWVIAEHHSDRAATLLDFDALHAPDHWQAEAINVVWAKVYRGELAADDGRDRMEALLRAPVIGTSIGRLLPRAFALSLALSVTVYNSLYVALAEQLSLPFITADRRLVRALAGDPALSSRSLWIGDFAG